MVVNKADIDQELEVPEREQDEGSREAESNLSGEEADTESDSTALNSDASSVRSFLIPYRAPTPSELARNRKLRTNPPCGAKKGKGAFKGDPKRISPADRVKEYQHENLIVSNRKVFCSACREELSTKKVP